MKKLLPVLCSTCYTTSPSPSGGNLTGSGDHTTSGLPSASSDTLSIQTFPSLPSLHQIYQNTPPLPLSTSSSSYSLFTPGNTQNALLFSSSSSSQNTPPLLYAASSTSLTIYQNALVPKSEEFTKIPLSAGAVKSLAATPSLLLTSHQDGKIRAWKKPRNNSEKVRFVSTLPTLLDRIIRYPIPSNHVSLRRHGRRHLRIQHADAVSSLAVSGSGLLLFSGSWDRTLKIWNLLDLRCLQTLSAHDDAINAVVACRDDVIFTGSADTRIRVWIRSGPKIRFGLLATLEKHKSAVNCLALDQSGSVLYSGSNDRSILVWEREESASYMTVVGALRGHRKAVMCLSTVGIGGLVSGSSDRTVRIWRRGGNREGYSCLSVLTGHLTGVRSVTAVVTEEEEGYRVCSGSSDGEIRIWTVSVADCKRSDS